MAYNVWNLSLAKWKNLTSFPTKALAESFLADVVEAEARVGTFLVRKAPEVLEVHGTKLMQLKPSMIWRCAMEDLERRTHNNAVQAGAPGEFKHYAFHRRHVIRASTANDIIRAAIDQPGLGLASGKRDTRLLYSDVALLKAALQ